MKHQHKQHFLEILQKYRQEKASPEEIKFLEAYYDVFDSNDALVNQENEADYNYLRENIKSAVDRKISGPNGAIKKLNWFLYSAAAAAVLILLSLSVYFFSDKKAKDMTAQIDQQIQPGSNKAVLTLANGQKITLNDAAPGEIAKQSGISITKTADGQIVYTILAGNTDTQDGEILKNTISTPKGGQYKVILPDGTQVLLNAATSLVYPTSFNGIERLVELNGEAYFEVAKNKDKPFKVRSGIQTVEVLGTHFNVNAYDDEDAIRTTLIEGSVKISREGSSGVIIPGQQAIVTRLPGGTVTKRNVNVEKEIAWRNGTFSFENDDIKSVMRSISRWYDVDVNYKGNVDDLDFTGEIFRTAKLSEVINILELNNVHVETQGRTLTLSYLK
jgi:transmembrane sensor